MDIKKEIEQLLETLKKQGKTREDIEKAFEYSENYIDQTLSRGGNKKVLAALKIYSQLVLQNTTPINGDLNRQNVLTEAGGGTKLTTSYDRLLEQILSDKQFIINQLEARRAQAEEMAKKMESHYEDAKYEKAKMLDIINVTLKEISGNLKETAISLAHNKDQLALLKDQTYIVSDQLEQQSEALGLNKSEEQKPVAPFVKKGNASSDVQQEGGKKGKRH